MANSAKNIVITPNTNSSTDDPKIVFSGASATAGAQNVTLKAYPTYNGTLSFEASNGQLFSIINNLSGTIFSVNDISGMPSIEVDDTGVIRLAQYTGNIIVGGSTDDGINKLQVNGTASINYQAAFTTSTPGTGRYGLHLGGQTTADYATGITFSAGQATSTNANAGIYVQGSGSYGTKMYIATTDAYVTGSKTAISIDHTGLVNFVRQRPQYNGSNLALVSELPSVPTVAGVYLPLSGGSMTGTLNLNSADQSMVLQQNGSGTAWLGRILIKNATADIATFMGNYNSRGGIFSHNNALNAWAPLYVNTLGASGMGTVYLPWATYINSSNSDTQNIVLHSANYNSYALPLGGGTLTGAVSGLSVNSIAHNGTSGTGDIGSAASKFATMYGVATSAQYADLAEKYLADQEYPIGTVVTVGGDKEVTAVSSNRCFVLGVVSANPAFRMNDDLENGTYIALTGRVPVLISCFVNKGDPIWPDTNGQGCNVDNGKHPFAFALESSGPGLVECVIK